MGKENVRPVVNGKWEQYISMSWSLTNWFERDWLNCLFPPDIHQSRFVFETTFYFTSAYCLEYCNFQFSHSSSKFELSLSSEATTRIDPTTIPRNNGNFILDHLKEQKKWHYILTESCSLIMKVVVCKITLNGEQWYWYHCFHNSHTFASESY